MSSCTQEPLEQVSLEEQSSNNWFSVEFEQYEDDVPALWQVYVLYDLYTSPPEQNGLPV